MTYIYLASPYSSPDATVRRHRYNETLKCLYWLTIRRIWAYSPIAHFHPLAEAHELPKGWEFWWDCNKVMIDAADSLLILALDQWQNSDGIIKEIHYCTSIDKPIRFITPSTYRIRDYEELK